MDEGKEAASELVVANGDSAELLEFEEELFTYANETHPDIIASIKETKDLTKENEDALKEMLAGFVTKFLADK